MDGNSRLQRDLNLMSFSIDALMATLESVGNDYVRFFLDYDVNCPGTYHNLKKAKLCFQEISILRLEIKSRNKEEKLGYFTRSRVALKSYKIQGAKNLYRIQKKRLGFFMTQFFEECF